MAQEEEKRVDAVQDEQRDDPRPGLSKYRTCELCEELEKREGVETRTVNPYEDQAITVNGPAIVFVVID